MPADRPEFRSLRTRRAAALTALAALLGLSACSTVPRPDADAGKALAIDAELVSWYGSRALAGLPYLTEFCGRSG